LRETFRIDFDERLKVAYFGYIRTHHISQEVKEEDFLTKGIGEEGIRPVIIGET